MARPRSFDEDKVLDAALACFWQHGYAATSVRDLAADMQINGPSLYNAFGDKRALFIRALDRYANQYMRERLERLERSHLPHDAIAAFFRELIDHSLSDTDRSGCFIVNTALELAAHDAEIGIAVAGYLDEVRRFFERVVRAGCNAAVARGEAPSEIVPRDVSRLLLGAMLGIRVMARTKPDRAMLEGMVRPVLAMLETQLPKTRTISR